MPTTTTRASQRPHHKLAKLRRKKGWSHLQLAEKSGVTYTTLQRIELGITARPHEDTQGRIADALGVSKFKLWP